MWPGQLSHTNQQVARYVSEAMLDRPGPAKLPSDGRCMSEPSQQQPSLVQIKRATQP